LKLLDANTLLYAYDSNSTHHEACRDWLNTAFDAEEIIALPWQTLLALVRIATNPRAVQQPLTGPEACEIVGEWLQRPNVVVLDAGERFWEIFATLVDEAQLRGPLVTDAALAALAIENGATLCSTERDFRRFERLKVLDPTHFEKGR
jgi:toxin-antitoxin system PIN domain toxin